MNPKLQEACDLTGGQTALAKVLTELTGEVVTQQRVRNWLFRDDDVPAEFAPSIEQATFGQVTRRDLRPNDWQRIWPELANTTIPGTPLDDARVREASGATRKVITDTSKVRT